jgi:hypothetical protein
MRRTAGKQSSSGATAHTTRADQPTRTPTRTPKVRRRERTSHAVLAQLDAMPEATAGRVYLCIGPHCYGRSANALQAERNARKHQPGSTYMPRSGWGWILYDTPIGTTVDEMDGGISWPRQDDQGNDNQPARELARFNVPERRS